MEKGRVIHSPLFLMRVMRSEGSTKFAAVAPKKIAKTAVDRNKLRRIIYNAIKTSYPRLVPSHHIGLFAKATAVGASFEVIAKDVHDLFVKAGILK